MLCEDLIQKAQEAGFNAVAHELIEASKRSEAKLYTEAVLRLGRATEASLYAVAREFGINLQLHIPKLAELQNALRGVEANILKKRDATEVKKLADISKQLAQAIAILMEDSESRNGKSGDRVRGNDSILNEIIDVIDEPGSKRRLGMNKPLLDKIMGERNSGAHASPTGELRETDLDRFPELEGDFQEFIESIIDVAIGQMSRNAMEKILNPLA